MSNDLMGQISFIAALIGLPGSIIAIVVYLARPRITLFKEDSLLLFDSITKNFPQLTMMYHNTAISKNLVLLKMALVNTGSKDITPEMIEQDIEITLPPNSTWADYAIDNASKNLKTKILKKGRSTLVIKTGLFKTNEFFKFQGLIETTDDMLKKSPFYTGILLDKSIKLNCRVSDLTKVSIKRIFPLTNKYENPWPSLLISIFLLIIAIFIYSQNIPANNGYIFAYPYQISKNHEINVSVTPIDLTTLRVDSALEDYHKKINVGKFFLNMKGSPKIISVDLPKYALPLMLIVIASFLLFFYIVENNNYRFRKLLSNIK